MPRPADPVGDAAPAPVPLTRPALRWLARAADPRKLLAGLKEAGLGRTLLRGFPSNAGALKNSAVLDRIAAAAEQQDQVVLSLLSAAPVTLDHLAEAFSSLRPDWILDRIEPMMRRFGPPPVVVVLAFQDDDELRRRAARYLARPGLFADDLRLRESACDEAVAQFAEDAGWIATLLPDDLDAAGAETTDPSPGEQTGRIADLERRLERRERDLKRARERWRHEESDFEKEQERLRGEIDRWRERAADRQRELRRLGEERDRDLEQARAETRDRILGPFRLRGPGTDVADDSGEPEALGRLIDRGERLLNEQAGLDAQYGTVAAARALIRRAHEIVGELDRCMEESVLVPPDLVQTREALARAITEWESKLRVAGEGDGSPRVETVASRLVRSVRSIPRTEEGLGLLDQVEEAFTGPAMSALMSPEDMVAILGAVRDQREWARTIVLEAERAGDPLPDRVERIGDLYGYLDARPDLADRGILLVDGYNMIRRIPEWARREERDFAGTRRRLGDALAPVAARWRRVELVFDGVEYRRDKVAGLEIVYSDRVAEEGNADRYLADAVRRYRADEPRMLLFLCTYDLRLVREIGAALDGWVDPFQLHALLERADG